MLTFAVLLKTVNEIVGFILIIKCSTLKVLQRNCITEAYTVMLANFIKLLFIQYKER